MEEKIKITEDNYREVVLKRSIILCWVLLAICFVIKIFGGNFFAIVCTNEKFIKVCEFVDNSIIKYIIYYIFFNISMYLLLIIAMPKIKLKSKSFIVYIVIINFTWIYKLLLDLNIIYVSTLIINILDFVIYFIVLLLLSRKPLRSFVAILLLFTFSIISAFVKNIGLHGVVTDTYLIAMIFSIDYYIMLVLSALYSKRIYLRRLK